MGVASGLPALSYILALLAAGALLTITGNFRLDGEQWCFSNPESINGPFITAKHWSLGSYGIAYITASVLREPGFQCTTIARAHLAENITFTGPATCRTLIPISVHHYWNTVTIKQTEGTNCSSCMYSDGSNLVEEAPRFLKPKLLEEENKKSMPCCVYKVQTVVLRGDVSPLPGPGTAAAPGLMDAAKGLIVHIYHVTSLVPTQPGMSAESMQPYVTYEVPGHKAHFTQSGSGPNVTYQDARRMVVRVDSDFCRWVQNGGGLHFLIFDASMPAAGDSEDAFAEQLGLVGEARVPLNQLLTLLPRCFDPLQTISESCKSWPQFCAEVSVQSRVGLSLVPRAPFTADHSCAAVQVQGNFPLFRSGVGAELPPVGYIELSVSWQDDPSSVLAPGVIGLSPFEADRGSITEEQFQVLWQRVIRRLHVLKLAPVDWFHKHDVDQDGFWSKAEFTAALSSMPLGLSALETDYIFNWTDRRRLFGAFARETAALSLLSCQSCASSVGVSQRSSDTMGKRGAAPAGPAWKKQRGSTVRSKINTVIAALRDVNLESEATETSRKMLAEGAVSALSQMVEDRHPMQTRIGDFIKETLEDIAARLQGKVDDAKKSVSTMESELEVQKAQLQAATDELAEAKEKVTKKAEQMAAAKKALGECEQADAVIARDEAGANRRQGQLTKEQSKFTDVRDNLLQVLIDDGINANGSAKESKKACDKLLKQITNLGGESALLAAAPAVLLKKPEEREGFDSHVLDCLKATLAEKLEEIQKGLDEISAEVEAKLPEKTAKAEETAKTRPLGGTMQAILRGLLLVWSALAQDSSCPVNADGSGAWFDPEKLGCQTCRVLEQRLKESGVASATLAENCLECCEEEPVLELFPKAASSSCGCDVGVASASLCKARLIADAAQQERDQDPAEAFAPGGLQGMADGRTSMISSREKRHVDYQAGSWPAIELETNDGSGRVLRADVKDWKSDHLVQFLNMRLEAAEDEGKIGAIGGAWSAEIQPPGSILRAGSDFQGPLARGALVRMAESIGLNGKVNFIPHHNPDLVFFNEHGEEQERLDLGRYNLQQIHDLMAAKGFKRSLTSSWSYDDFSLPAGPFESSSLGMVTLTPTLNFVPHHPPVFYTFDENGNEKESIDMSDYSLVELQDCSGSSRAKAAFDEAQKELDVADEVACEKEVGLVKAKTQVEATEQALQDQAKVIEAATGEVDAFSEVLAVFTEAPPPQQRRGRRLNLQKPERLPRSVRSFRTSVPSQN
eukprot:s162_g33.t2